jgi:hypothetical protein
LSQFVQVGRTEGLHPVRRKYFQQNGRAVRHGEVGKVQQWRLFRDFSHCTLKSGSIQPRTHASIGIITIAAALWP